MKKILRHIGLWIGAVMMLLLTACSSDSSSDSTNPDDVPTTLRLYVYTPDQPILTRADNGEVDPRQSTLQIKKLQIWVFRHDTGELVAYFSPTSVDYLNTNNNETYEVAVNNAFVTEKPRVDVYAVGNASMDNIGLTFDEETTREQLDNAIFGHTANGDFFGVTDPTTVVPVSGLPRSGVLKNQPVYGTKPVLRIGSEEDGMATLRLVRSVSKVRFVFSNSVANTEQLKITAIRLAGGVIPTTEYLFLTDDYTPRAYRIGTMYEPAQSVLAENVSDDVTRSTNPRNYVFTTQTGQQYEDLINDGINNNELTPCGPFYFRESDQKLLGNISYQIDDGPIQTMDYEMAVAGDFSRNHTWIVYAYYYGGDELRLSMAYIRDWSEEDRDHEIYNW